MSLSNLFAQLHSYSADLLPRWMSRLAEEHRWMVYTGASLAGAVGAGMLFVQIQPARTLDLFEKFNALRAGVTVKFVKGEKYTYRYGERGEARPGRPTLIFVDGYSGSLNSWIPLVREMPPDMHIILAELPGQGKSSIPDEEDYCVYKTRDFLYEFVNIAKLTSQPFHVIGESMGGLMVAMLAAQYPHYVETVTVVDPACKAPMETELMQHGRDSDSKYAVESVETMKLLFGLVFYDQSKVPKGNWIYKAMLERRKPFKNYYKKCC